MWTAGTAPAALSVMISNLPPMTQATRLPVRQEMRNLVTEGRTAEPADRVIALDEAERG